MGTEWYPWKQSTTLLTFPAGMEDTMVHAEGVWCVWRGACWSFLDLLNVGWHSDGDLDLALRLLGDKNLVLGVGKGEEKGVENPVESTSKSSSTISSSTASMENLF